MSNENSVPYRTNNIDRHLGRRLRLVRELSNFSQSELARRLGINVDQLARYEIGNERMPASQLFQAASIVDVPGPWFFEDLASTRIGSKISNARLEVQVVELTGLIRQISDKNHLSNLRESAQNRLHEIYNIVND